MRECSSFVRRTLKTEQRLLPFRPCSANCACILLLNCEPVVTLGLDTSRLGFSPSKAMCLPSRLRSSPRLISTGQLHALPRFHLRPINHVVYMEPYLLKSERSHLRGSFTLRCLQRLSRPNVATQLCRWHDNWCTRGSSIPVLSY